MLRRRGWSVGLAGAGVLLLGLLTLDVLVLLLGIGFLAFVATDWMSFELAGPARGVLGLRASRSAPRTVVRGQEFQVRTTLDNPARWPGDGTMHERLTDGLEWVDRPGTGEIVGMPNGRTVRTARLRAVRRGAQAIGPALLSQESAFGLAGRTVAVAPERPVLVFPTVPVSRPGRLVPALYSRVQGLLALRQRGFGTEFRSLRDYRPSDDLRHVAWKRSTPRRLVVREFHQESRQDLLVAIDVSRGMAGGPPGATALDHVVVAASMVAGFVTQTAEDRIGLATYSGRLRQYLGPDRGTRHHRRLVTNLALLEAVDGEFSLGPFLQAVQRRLGHPTHLLLFSSLRTSTTDLAEAARRFRAAGHRLYAFVPDFADLYSPPAAGVGGAAVLWARERERARSRSVRQLLGNLGVPAVPFDRRGAAAAALLAYSRVRAWGSAR